MIEFCRMNNIKLKAETREKRTIRVRAESASNRSILPESGSPTAPATLIASRAWRHPIMPGTVFKRKKQRTKQLNCTELQISKLIHLGGAHCGPCGGLGNRMKVGS